MAGNQRNATPSIIMANAPTNPTPGNSCLGASLPTYRVNTTLNHPTGKLTAKPTAPPKRIGERPR